MALWNALGNLSREATASNSLGLGAQNLGQLDAAEERFTYPRHCMPAPTTASDRRMPWAAAHGSHAIAAKSTARWTSSVNASNFSARAARPGASPTCSQILGTFTSPWATPPHRAERSATHCRYAWSSAL